MAIMKLENYLEEVDRYATGEVAESCISSLIGCFQANGIDMTKLPKFESSTALRRGLPFTYINPDAYDDELFSKVCDYYSKNHKFNENDFSEISTIALLVAIKAKLVGRVERSMEKSHDFDVSWYENEIEVEVTRPGEKDEWSKRVLQSQDIVNYISKLKREFSIFVYIVDLLSQSDLEELQSLISGLTVGNAIEEVGKWSLIAEKPKGDPHVLLEVKKDDRRPAWWPKHALNGFSMFGMAAGEDQTEPLPRIHVKFSCPFKGYINRVKKKATNFQGTRSKPFLLVLDVNELGDAFKEIEKNLEHYFCEWKHITAVLVYADYYSHKEVGWEFQVFVNPYAVRKFDETTHKILHEYSVRKRAVKHYA
jgi:hypothetical protein